MEVIALDKVKSTVSGTTLVSGTVDTQEGDLLVVVTANNNAADGVSGVTYGPNQSMSERTGISRGNVGGRQITVWFYHLKRNASRVVTATWPTANTNRGMIVFLVRGASRKDVVTTAIQDASTTPSTGTTATVQSANQMAIAFMCSDGDRTNDLAGTPQNSFTQLDRVGTSNLDLRVYYRDLNGLTPLAGIECSLTGATNRDWTSSIIVLHPVVDAETQIVIYGANYEALIDSTDASKQNAILVYLHAYYSDALPLEPGTEWLGEINITALDYDNAVTLLQNLGIVETRTDEYFLVRTAT